MDTDVVPLSHFALFVTCMYAKDTNFIFDMSQLYTCIGTQTHLQRHQHIQIDTCTQTYIGTHANKHRHTCIFFTYKHTYIYYRSILPTHFLFSCHLPNELRSPWTFLFFFFAILITYYFCDLVSMIDTSDPKGFSWIDATNHGNFALSSTS